MTKLLHNFLLDGILIQSATKSYGKILCHWPFLPDWECLQSPLHHLYSYSLVAYTRWFVIASMLLCFWLESKLIHLLFIREAMWQLDLGPGEEASAVDFIVKAYVCLAKSNSVLIDLKVSVEDWTNMDQIVLEICKRFQMLYSFIFVTARGCYCQYWTWHICKA